MIYMLYIYAIYLAICYMTAYVVLRAHSKQTTQDQARRREDTHTQDTKEAHTHNQAQTAKAKATAAHAAHVS